MLLPFFYLYVRQLYTVNHLSSMDPAQAPVAVAAATALHMEVRAHFSTELSKICNRLL